MKKYLKIKNDGELDLRLIMLMGGTTKRDSPEKIGNFGTGLKYIIATMFRREIDFKLMIGETQVEITTSPEEIRGNHFDVIHINGEKTGITAQMGYDWEPWTIIREIYSNALDEGGANYEVTNDITGKPGETHFYIELVPEILEVYNNWTNYFVVNMEPMFENDKFRVFPNKGKMRIYKQGILIHEKPETKSLFAYDIKEAQINELRQYTGSLSYDIFKCLSSFDKKTVEYFLENITNEFFESDMEYNWFSCDFGEAWKDAIGDALLIHDKALESMEARGIEVEKDNYLIVPEKLYKALTKVFKGVGALRVAQKINEFFEVKDERLEMKIKQALAILETSGYYIDPELKFLYGVFGDKTVFAKVDIDSKEIFISEKLLDKSLFDICSTLIEENEHYKTGFQDCSRDFQQHFIDLYTKTLFDLNEIKL